MAGFPLPELEWEGTRPFWEAAARSELVIPRCQACGGFVWYPRERCRACRSADLAWTPVSGRATLFSYTIVRHVFVKAFAEVVPYATGLVALEEDPRVRLASLLVDCDPKALRLDQPVRVVFRRLPYGSTDVRAPLFTPA